MSTSTSNSVFLSVYLPVCLILSFSVCVCLPVRLILRLLARCPQSEDGKRSCNNDEDNEKVKY